MTTSLQSLNLQLDLREGDTPIYQRIADSVREAVAAGNLAPGERLPAMTALAKRLGVSPLTVGRSYELLEAGGIVTRSQGSGTFVQARALRQVQTAAVRRVGTLHMLLGVDCLAKVSPTSMFIVVDLVAGILEVLDPRQTHLVYAATLADCFDELRPDDAVVTRSPVPFDPRQVRELSERGVRMACMWEPHLLMGSLPYVTKDYHQAAVLPCRHLVECGYRRIGYIGRRVHHHTLPVSLKFSAFFSVMNEAGLDVRACHVGEPEAVPGAAYRVARQIMAGGDLPEAFFVDTDYKAMEVIAALTEAGIRVPQDIGIASYDDVPEAATFSPALTTVRTPRREIGRRVGHMLLNWPTDGTLPESVLLPSELVVRQSTRVVDPSGTEAAGRAIHL